jgi:hypothetical protein
VAAAGVVVAVCAIGCSAGSLLLVAAVVVGAAGLLVAAAVVVVVPNRVEGACAIACRIKKAASGQQQALSARTLCTPLRSQG